MVANITETEEGKTVVNADGEEIGIVSEVHDNVAAVESDPDLTDEMKAKLGWEATDPETDTYRLREEAVRTTTDDEVHLRGELDDGSEAGREDAEKRRG